MNLHRRGAYGMPHGQASNSQTIPSLGMMKDSVSLASNPKVGRRTETKSLAIFVQPLRSKQQSQLSGTAIAGFLNHFANRYPAQGMIVARESHYP
tara:strand:- start:43 stop:327 length:285 start_codon:yes stop_codon:yes gene_type:complete